MVKKGQEGVFLGVIFMIIVLIVIFTVSIKVITEPPQKTEVRSEISLYNSLYALKFAKLYLETALDYSVYQAMYDLGKSAGLGPGERGEMVEDREELEKNLKAGIVENLNAYTTGSNQIYNFMGKEVSLPEFTEDDITITETPSGMKVSVESEKSILLKEVAQKELGRESITLEFYSDFEKTCDFNFFSLHDKAVEVSKTISDCKDEKREEGNYEINIDADTNQKPCKVEVSVTDTSKTFPVSDGKGASFEPVSSVFLIDVTETGISKPYAAPTPQKAENIFADKVIVLDPGHGGEYPGAVFTSKDPDSGKEIQIMEKDVNLEIAKKLKEAMEKKGAKEVWLTRDVDSIVNTKGEDLNNDGQVDLSDDLLARTKIANDNDADIFISIHANSNPGCTSKGTETYVWCVCPDQVSGQVDICQLDECDEKNSFFEDSKKLANKIQSLLSSTIKTNNRGVFGADMTVLQKAKMPAILIETAYICNEKEAELLNDPKEQIKIAEAIISGMEEYYA